MRYCKFCGREMEATNKKLGAQFFDASSGQKMRSFGLEKKYSESKIVGSLRCPSRLCRLLHYSWGACHVDYILLNTGEVVEDLYHAI